MRERRAFGAILWVSVVGLFLELLLIRWIATEIRIFAYLQNTVLVVCFLGIGAGLFTSRNDPGTLRGLSSLALLVSLLCLPPTRRELSRISEYLSVLGDVNIWFAWGGGIGVVESVSAVIVGLAMTFLLMVLVLDVFVVVGRLLGRSMEQAPRPLAAYSVNVAGSLVGTWLFALLGVMGMPPALWFGVLALLVVPFAWFLRERGRFVALALVPVLASIGAQWADDDIAVWSPYQKLVLRPDFPWKCPHHGVVQVNNVGYQAMIDLGPGAGHNDPEMFPPDMEGRSQYDLPTLLHPDPARVLVVGSGTGNDVAGALRNGAGQVTAVEIDPAILDLGRRYHPEHPYDDPRVRVVNDDARVWFANTDERYDVITFGLLDSHTTSVMTNTRLDHFVYTRESFERVKGLLNEGGIVVVSFEMAGHPFIADRLGRTLKDVFGHEPRVFRVPESCFGWGGTMFVVGDPDRLEARIGELPRLGAMLAELELGTSPLTYSTPPATDDWPYLYLSGPRIPPLFLLLGILVAGLVWYLRSGRGVREGFDPREWTRSEWHFAALGAGFLLLEVSAISAASVALGSTWIVSAVIISGVLVMVLLANVLVATWERLPTNVALGLLLASVAGLFALDLSAFLDLGRVPRAIVVGGVTTLPMAFSGVVFARAFRVAPRTDAALGANVLGALIGALLSCTSMLVGLRSLLVLVFVFYSLAALSQPGASAEGTRLRGA